MKHQLHFRGKLGEWTHKMIENRLSLSDYVERYLLALGDPTAAYLGRDKIGKPRPLEAVWAGLKGHMVRPAVKVPVKVARPTLESTWNKLTLLRSVV
jgi:hypothetical protein